MSKRWEVALFLLVFTVFTLCCTELGVIIEHINYSRRMGLIIEVHYYHVSLFIGIVGMAVYLLITGISGITSHGKSIGIKDLPTTSHYITDEYFQTKNNGERKYLNIVTNGRSVFIVHSSTLLPPVFMIKNGKAMSFFELDKLTDTLPS